MWGFPSDPGVKNVPCNAGDMGLIRGPGRPHMPWGSSARLSQLLSPCATAAEACGP